jgi:hypothetical protein
VKSSTLNKIVILSARGFRDLSCEILDFKQNRHPERSASPIYPLIRLPCGAESKDLGGAYLAHAAWSFSTTDARSSGQAKVFPRRGDQELALSGGYRRGDGK